jgi:2'-5' RNA ligase
MEDLAEEIDTRMERFGFDKESFAFRPHLTLARAKGTRLTPPWWKARSASGISTVAASRSIDVS